MILVIFALGLFIRLLGLSQSLWLDEAAQAIESQQSLSFIWQNLKADFHPPLFHLLLHFWELISLTDWWLRLLPILISMLLIFSGYRFIAKYVGKTAGVIFSLLAATNPFLVYYSQEIRPYVLGAWLGLLSVQLFYEWCQRPQRGWSLSLLAVNILALYSSYFNGFIFLGQLLFLLWQKQFKLLRNYCIILALVGITFLFWLPQFIGQLRISQGVAEDLSGWSNAVATPVSKVLPLVLTKFVIGQINFRPESLYVLIVVVALLPYLYPVCRLLKSRNNLTNYLIIVSAVGLMVPVLTSLVLQIASPKRLLYVLPLFLMLLSISLAKLPTKISRLLIAVILISNTIFLTIYYTNPEFQREQWRQAVAKVETLSTPQTAQIFKFTDPFAPVEWYARKPIQTVKLTENLQIHPQNAARLIPLLADKQQVFLYQYLGELTDPQHLTDQQIQSLGFKRIATFNYAGVGLIDEYQR